MEEIHVTSFEIVAFLSGDERFVRLQVRAAEKADVLHNSSITLMMMKMYSFLEMQQMHSMRIGFFFFYFTPYSFPYS